MDLLPPTSFAAAVASSKNTTLKRISKIISKFCGENDEEKFMASCRQFDYETTNNILDKLVKVLTGNDESVSSALESFADRFLEIQGLNKEVFSAFTDKEKILAIEKYREQILEVIDKR
ncbi:MAG: hypothetical protein IJ583_09655 [Firmicutes bacterium]|nr:hypothetical protein [Bacillota bacterium]